jgi:hypothetical protein
MELTRRGYGAPWIMEVAVEHRLWHIAQADEPLDPLPPPFLVASSHKEASSRLERLQQDTAGTGRALQGIESQAAWSGWAWGLGTSPRFLRLRGPHGHNKVPPHRTQGRKKTRPGEDGFCRPWNGSMRRHSRATRNQSFCEDMNES